MLSHGADVDAVDLNGNAAIHVACKTGNPNIVRLVLDFNPDLTVVNRRWKSPLDVRRVCV